MGYSEVPIVGQFDNAVDDGTLTLADGSTMRVRYVTQTLDGGTKQTIVLDQYDTEILRWRVDHEDAWDNSGNWTAGLSPTAEKHVVIDASGNVTVTGPSGSVTVATLTVGGGGGTNVLQLTSGATLTVTGGTTVTAGGVLTGKGAIAGDLIVANGGTIAPGNSPGFTDHIDGNLIWQAGGHYDWELHDAAGAAGVGYDQYRVLDGKLIIDIDAGTFNINLWTLSEVGPDVDGPALNFSALSNYTWTILTTSGGIEGFDSSLFTIWTSPNHGTAGFANLLGGQFSLRLSGDGNDLLLDYISGYHVPEPTALAMIAAPLLMIGLRRRRA